MQPFERWLNNGDFNGMLRPNLLPLHCGDDGAALDVQGRTVVFAEGMVLTVFDEDTDEDGRPDRLFATGTVVPSPWPVGRRWYLDIDDDGVRHESDLIPPQSPPR
ncbi:hypothetical protein ABU614_11490 [Lysobacter firmicutimachus]|uniref:Uncharacterized protein n=1 Tax=Lysobacter firmicutimachus TaxID=1792846 RepID=A0AAU8MYT3_9GAMM